MRYPEKKSHKKQLFFIVLIGALPATVTLFCLEKTGVTNLNSKPVSTAGNEARPENNIDYSPASPTDNNDINQQKESGSISTDAPQPSQGSPISISLTAATQDDPKGPLIIRTLINDATSGACQLTISKGSITKTYDSQVQASGTYYRCSGFDIAPSELSTGTWHVTVTVKSGDRSGSVERDVEISV